MRLLFLFVLVQLSLAAATQVFAKDAQDPLVINWGALETPPWYINKGPNKGQGIVDQTIAMLANELPQYHHKTVVLTIPRGIALSKAGMNLCTAFSYKLPSRLEYAHFSLPSNVLLSPRVIMRKDKHQRDMNAATTVSYDVLLGNPKFTGIFQQGRTNRSLDSILEKHRAKSHIDTQVISMSQMYQMVMLGRRDYLTIFPFVAEHLHQTLLPNIEYASIEIEENNAFGLVYVSCSKTAWGAKVIENINAALKRIRPRQQYRAIMEQWLNTQMLAQYREFYDANILNNAR